MRTSILMAALIAALSIIPLTARAANSVPKFDIAKNCKADLTVNTGSGETLESCTRDEEAARDQIDPAMEHVPPGGQDLLHPRSRARRHAELCRVADLSRDGRPKSAYQGQAIARS